MPQLPFERRPDDRTETARVIFMTVFGRGLAGTIFAICWAGLAAAEDAQSKPTNAENFPPAAAEFFEARVRPILVDQCLKCHGPKKQSSGLRLDSREAVLKGGDSGPAVVLGKPEESLLVQAVARTHAELKMPPAGKLPEPSVAILRQWVGLGAPWARRRGQGVPNWELLDAADGSSLGISTDTDGWPRRRSTTATGCARPSMPSCWPGSKPRGLSRRRGPTSER